MFNRIALEFNDRNINMVSGNKKFIRACDSINLKEDCVVDGRIVNEEVVEEIVNEFIVKHRINSKNLYVTIQGQDIITRFTELPIDENSLRSNIEWEFKQYIPDVGQNYYIDYEIVEKCVTEEMKYFKVLMVAVPKAKIDSIVALSDKLKLNLKAIDTITNSMVRTFKVSEAIKTKETMGVITIGFKACSLAILEGEVLNLERQVPFGVFNVLKEIADVGKYDLEYLGKNYEQLIGDKSIQHFYNENENIQRVVGNFLNNLTKIIQFYNTGKVKKDFKKIYIVSKVDICSGVDEIIESYFGCKAILLKDAGQLGIKLNHPSNWEFAKFMSLYGTLVRSD